MGHPRAEAAVRQRTGSRVRGCAGARVRGCAGSGVVTAGANASAARCVHVPALSYPPSGREGDGPSGAPPYPAPLRRREADELLVWRCLRRWRAGLPRWSGAVRGCVRAAMHPGSDAPGPGDSIGLMIELCDSALARGTNDGSSRHDQTWPAASRLRSRCGAVCPPPSCKAALEQGAGSGSERARDDPQARYEDAAVCGCNRR